MSEQVLHLDFIKLTPATGPEERSRLAEAATGLREIDGVAGVGVIEGDAASDFDVAFWFLLREFKALEPFGTDARYARFLQASVAPLLDAFAGADVKLDADVAAQDGAAACVALAGPEEAYDFEVREALEAWSGTFEAGSLAVGIAVGERQAFRGAAIAFGADGAVAKPAIEPFRATMVRGAGRTLA